jgi:hypothetical protein
LSNKNGGTSELHVVSPYGGLGHGGLQHLVLKVNGLFHIGWATNHEKIHFKKID